MPLKKSVFLFLLLSHQKKITDILARSEPKPGTPEDLQKLMKGYYSSSRSVIELEELTLPGATRLPVLPSNDRVFHVLVLLS